jgi:hypothetical protein
MIDFKRILIGIMFICSANIAFADSYIVVSDLPISDVKCEDSTIISIRALTTLSNEKKSLIITSLKDGSTQFTLTMKNKPYSYKVDVKNGVAQIKGDNVVKILPIDLPPEALPEVNQPCPTSTKECDK